MRGFMFIAVGLALLYVVVAGKVGDFLVAVLTGYSPATAGTKKP